MYSVDISFWGLVISICLGGVVASFVECFATNSDNLWRRSVCDACRKPLGMRQLIPIFSALMDRKPCKECGTEPSWWYGFTEFSLAAAWAMHYMLWGFSEIALFLNLWAAIALYIAIKDWYTQQVPLISLILMGALAIWWVFLFPTTFYIAGGLLILSIGIALGGRLMMSRQVLGAADIVLLTLAGVWVPLTHIPHFLVMVGLFGIISAKISIKSRASADFPFTPAILLATWIILLATSINYQMH